MPEAAGGLIAVFAFCIFMTIGVTVAMVVGGLIYWLIFRFIRWGVTYPRRR